jgi:hypothetical protein
MAGGKFKLRSQDVQGLKYFRRLQGKKGDAALFLDGTEKELRPLFSSFFPPFPLPAHRTGRADLPHPKGLRGRSYYFDDDRGTRSFSGGQKLYYTKVHISAKLDLRGSIRSARLLTAAGPSLLGNLVRVEAISC